MLRTLLDSHPDLRCHGECWSNVPEDVFDPTQLGEKEGFLVKYNQVIDRPERIKLLRSAKIIHLQRRDMEKQAASYGAMRKTGVKFTDTHPDIPKVGVRLKNIHGWRGIAKIKRHRKEILKMGFENVMDVFYEDITGDGEIQCLSSEQAKPMLDFLGVRQYVLVTNLVKTDLYTVGVGKGRK